MTVGFTLPFAKSTGSLGYFEMTNDEASAVVQNVRSLLLTNWGERVGHYNMGCNFIEFIFQPLKSDELRSRIGDRVVSQMSTWMPFVTINELNVFFHEDDSSVDENALRVRMVFSIAGRPDLKGLLEQSVPA